MTVALRVADQQPGYGALGYMSISDPRLFPGPSYPLSRSRHLVEHLSWMQMRGLSDRTVFCRRRSVVLLAEHLGNDPADADHGQLQGWQRHLERTSLGLVRWQTGLIRPYYRWLHQAGYRRDDPSALLPVPRGRRGLPRPMAEHKVMRMIEQAPPRLVPWLLLAGWSGLRAGEIAGLRVDDFSVDATGHAWVRVLGKGDKVRDVGVPPWAWARIAATLPETGRAWRRQRRAFNDLGAVHGKHVSQACNDYLHSIGITDTLHSLRHRVATVTLDQSGDIRMVQELLGHASLTTTQVYTRVNPRKIADALDALPAPPDPHRVGRHLHVVDEEGTA